MFQEYGRTLHIVKSLKCTGILLTVMYSYWPEVLANLQKLHKIWTRILRILEWDGEETRTMGNFYLAIVQAVLPFGAET